MFNLCHWIGLPLETKPTLTLWLCLCLIRGRPADRGLSTAREVTGTSVECCRGIGIESLDSTISMVWREIAGQDSQTCMHGDCFDHGLSASLCLGE